MYYFILKQTGTSDKLKITCFAMVSDRRPSTRLLANAFTSVGATGDLADFAADGETVPSFTRPGRV